MSNKFTRYILIAMALGVVMGALVYDYLPQDRADIASSINLIALLFLRLIKMIIAPLVFATLVGGIAHMGSGSKLGRIFAKTMGWFVCASFVSLLLGNTEILADAHPAQTGTLTFTASGLTAGALWFRLRVDGVDSLLVDRSKTPPVYDPTQQVTVT